MASHWRYVNEAAPAGVSQSVYGELHRDPGKNDKSVQTR